MVAVGCTDGGGVVPHLSDTWGDIHWVMRHLPDPLVLASPRKNADVWVPVNVKPSPDGCVPYVAVTFGVSTLSVETAWTCGVVVLEVVCDIVVTPWAIMLKAIREETKRTEMHNEGRQNPK